MTNIVMLVQNRYKLTKQSLESLRQHTDPAHYNLTIVDDESTDFRTRGLVLRTVEEMHNATALHVSGSNHVLGALKNLGVAWSEMRFGRGDWLYLSDNDVYFLPDWLEILDETANYKESEFSLWGGQNHPYHQPIGEELNLGLSTNHSLKYYQALAGTSWLMRWETWDAFGPIHQGAAGPGQSEDFEFSQRIMKDGYKVGAIDPPVVLDCGITQTDGKPSPGAEMKPRVQGVYYE